MNKVEEKIGAFYDESLSMQAFTELLKDDDYHRKCEYCVFTCSPLQRKSMTFSPDFCPEFVLSFDKYLREKGVI